MKSHNGTHLFSPDELSFLASAAPCVWWRAFILLAATTGLRTSEILRLHSTDFDAASQSIRITADVVDSAESSTLRSALPAYRERSITIDRRALHAIEHLQADRRGNEYLFVPDWKVQQLWLRLISGESVSNELLCPRLHEWFRMIQGRARLLAAKASRRTLAQTLWPVRPLSALRATAIETLAETMSPRALARHLGCASSKCLLRHYDRRLQCQGGAA